MDEPAQAKPIAMRIGGHLVRGSTFAEFTTKLRALGEVLDFHVEEVDGGVRLSVVDGVTVASADPATLPN